MQQVAAQASREITAAPLLTDLDRTIEAAVPDWVVKNAENGTPTVVR